MLFFPPTGSTINERRKLGLNGQIAVALAIGKDGRANGEPQVSVKGVPVEDERDAFITEAAEAASKAAGGKKRGNRPPA